MKILNIYFKNINSLEGENRIHFDQAPIADGGVFAITGLNGSGKSSILDVITLGLYGETFRFDRPAEHVMTKSAGESFAEVEFSLGEDKYKSCWHVNRKNSLADGEFLPAEMKMLKLNGSEQVLADSTQKVRDKMTELTGMDFHKFSKSMVLAQGDFSAFLNALDSERMDILEKISGADFYAEFQQQVEDKYFQAQTRLQQLEQDLNAIPVLDEATREAKELDLSDFKEQLIEFENEQLDIQEQLDQVKIIADLKNKQEILLIKRGQIENQFEDNQREQEHVDARQDVIQFQEELSVVDEKAEQVQKNKNTLESYRSEMEMLQQQLKSRGFDEKTEISDKSLSKQKRNVDELKLKFSELKFDLPKENAFLQSLKQQLEEKKSVLNTSGLWIQEHSTDESLLDNFPETEKLRVLRDELSDLTKKQKALAKWSKDTSFKLNKAISDTSALNKKNSELKAQIIDDEKASEEMAEGNSLLGLQELESGQQERLNNFQELIELARVNSKISKKGFFSPFISAKLEGQEEKKLQVEAEQLQLEIGREKNIVKTLEMAVSNEILLKKMQSDRQHLLDGKPCPLCGALQHPYSKNVPASGNSKQVLTEQHKKVKVLMSDAANLSKKIVAVQNQSRKDEQKDSQLQNIRTQWNRLANKLNTFSMELDINNLAYMKDLLNVEKKEMDNVSKLLKKYSKRQSSIVQAKAAIEANEITLNRLDKETESLKIEKNSRPLESTELEKAYLQCQKDEKELAEKVLKQLDSLGEKIPSKSKENALLERLQTRRKEYQAHFSQKKSVTEEVQTLETELISCSNKITKMNNNIQQSSEQVEQEETVGLHLSLVEKQKLIFQQETVFSEQEKEISSLKQSLLDKIKQENGISDLNSLRETIALVKRLPEIQQQQLDFKQSLENIEKELNQTQLQVDSMLGKKQINKTEDELLAQLKSLNEKLDISKQEVESLQSQLGKQQGLQEKKQQILVKLATHKEVVAACEVDNKLITDGNGMHFRHKVQQVMADKLLSHTNQILEKISGRYYLRKVESEHGLALEIEDTKQFNVRRLPKSLSGGESFIVSLALALALAEMTNTGYAVDSLFLDEGFGNLDAESLYLVLTTLESLKTHGKVVGIISHVEGVRKRIKTQIEMIKKPNGLSYLKMVS